MSNEKNATPNKELERQIMSSLVPKNEREHWACGEIESLRQQLAAALAACKAKDALSERAKAAWAHRNDDGILDAIIEVLAIKPDASALKAWLGEPVGEVKKHTGSLKDMAIIVWAGEQPAEGTKLYAPKGVTK